MLKIFILFILLISLSPLAPAGIVSITNDDNELLVGKALEIMEDPTSRAALDDLRNRTDWTKSTADQPNFGFSQSAWWARFSLHMNSERETQWYLQVDDAILNQVDVYIIDQQKTIHFKGGGWVDASSRHVAYRTHLFKLPLRTGDSYHIYIRVKSELAVVLPIRIIDANKLTEIVTEDVWVYGLYFGSMTAMLFFNAFVWLRMPRMETLLYCAFSLCMIFVALCFCGFGKLFLWQAIPHADNYIFTLMLAVNFLILIPLFVERFLFDSSRMTRGMAIRSRAIILLGVTAIFVTLVFGSYWGIQCVAVFSVLSIINVVINSLSAVKNGRPGSKVFLYAWSLNLVAILVFVARSFGLLPNNAWTANIILLSTAIECFVLMLAMVEKARRLADEVAKAESVVLSSLESEVLRRTQQLADTQQRLVALEKRAALSVFSSGIAQQIEAPLSRSMRNIYGLATAKKSFRSYLRVLMGDEGDDSITTEFDSRFERLQKSHILMLEGGLRIKRIVKPLLGNDSGVDSDPAFFALVPVVNDAWRVASSDTQCPVAFHNELAEDFLWWGHESALRATLLALFSNAIHAIEDSSSPTVGAIRVNGSIEEDRQTLCVSDTGVGIRASDTEKVFDAFFTTKTVGRGAGLGLTVSRDSVQRWGGELTFSSSPGIGTVFRISAPRSGRRLG